MNVLCVVVVLSLIPACQPGSLACDLLLKPVEEGPDVSHHPRLTFDLVLKCNECFSLMTNSQKNFSFFSQVTGRWHLIAVSSNYCWVTALLNSLILPSFKVDVTSSEKSDYYDANIRIKM